VDQRPETLKLLQERAGSTLEHTGINNNFLYRTPLPQQLGIADKWENMKLKSFCIPREMVIVLKRLPTEWEKMFVNYTSDKGLITRIYRELKMLNSQRIKEPVKKWVIELNRNFSKEEVQMSKKHMKKWSPSLIIKKIQIKN
jgi:hypothetical protein